MAVLRRHDGEQLHQAKRQMGYRIGGGGFKAGERATLPRGQGTEGRGGWELTHYLTRDADNVDIATYVIVERTYKLEGAVTKLQHDVRDLKESR